MELTRYDRERLGQILGAVSLAGHALPAFVFAQRALSIPMEAGGLVIGPILGLPLLVVGVIFVIGAIVLPTGRTPFMPFAALALTVLVDLVLLTRGTGFWWAVPGLLLSATALALFVSLATLTLGMPGKQPQTVGDQALLAVVAMGGAAGLALVLASLAP